MHSFRKKSHLGHVVSDLGILTDPAKTSAISTRPTPTNCKQLQAFLGLASYYRRFVKDFAKIARPLHRLTEANRKFTWDSQCQNAFDSLRQKLVSAPVLALPDFATQLFWTQMHQMMALELSYPNDKRTAVNV